MVKISPLQRTFLLVLFDATAALALRSASMSSLPSYTIPHPDFEKLQSAPVGQIVREMVKKLKDVQSFRPVAYDRHQVHRTPNEIVVHFYLSHKKQFQVSFAPPAAVQ